MIVNKANRREEDRREEDRQLAAPNRRLQEAGKLVIYVLYSL